MFKILIFLVFGFFIGVRIKISERLKKYNARFQHIGVLVLIFIMGVGIGINKDLLMHLKSIGIKSLTFAIMTSLGSIAVVYTVTKLIGMEVEK